MDVRDLGLTVSRVIEDTREARKKMKRNYLEYMGEVEILDRVFENELKINSKIANDFRGEIVNGIVGYMFGKPVVWKVKSESERERAAVEIFRRRNGMAELDQETAEHMTICGVGARLCWVDKSAEVRVKNLRPWEVAFVTEPGTDAIVNVLYVYEREIRNGGLVTTETHADWYDDEMVHFLVNRGGGWEAREDPKPHLFAGVPVIRFENNNLLMGDFDKVRSLIDAYDRVVSDSQNEIEEFRLAYMVFIGAEPTEEVMTQARRTGAFGMDQDSDIRFITKQINGDFINSHLKLLRENIYKFAQAVDMTDENFSGYQQSGESRRWKLLAFENRAVQKERKFVKGLDEMMRIVASAWEKREIRIKPEEIDYVFTRNLPVDLLYTAEVSSKLKGLVSEETRLSLLPFVEDVEKEKEEMEKEGASRLEAQSPGGSSGVLV